jgi:subtilisin-like proprotein convertase family protein
MRTPALIAAAAAAALLSPAAFGQYTLFQNDPIAIPAVGAVPAGLYPSGLFVTSADYPYTLASKVTVTLHGFTHTWPDDVDIMLRNSSYNINVMVMSDVGGSTDVSGLTITLDPTALTPLPDSGPLLSGTFRPTDLEPGDSVPAPAPAAPYAGLAALQGFIPLNGWDLYVADDNDQDGGSIAGWSLTIHPATTNRWSTNNTGATVPTVGTAAIYPLTLNVHGIEGTPALVLHTLRIRHDYPEDLDILLVGPDGTSCVLMSDAGGSTPTTYTELQWRAPALGTAIPSPLPSFVSALPTNLGASTDLWPAPAPLGPYGNSMAPFLTASVNGTWKLFVNDDTGPDAGNIAFWSIQINGQTFCSADFNQSGTVSVQDIFDFLAAYFAGCP